MADIGEPQATPNVGIRGNPESLPINKRTTGIEAHSSTPNFVGAYAGLAASPSLLGDIGSKLAINSAEEFAKQQGYAQGSHPSGELFPAISKTGEVFRQAYSNQAHATLGLEANKLLTEGQLEVQKANKLTPGLIQSYKKNMTEGMQEILENAPSTVRPQLENEMASNVQRTTGQLESKLITQQKEDYRQQQVLFNQTQTKNVYEAAMSGQVDTAQSILDSQIARNKELASQGVITPATAESHNIALKQTYYSGLYGSGALTAQREKRLPEFLDKMSREKPKDVSFQEWQAVERNTLTLVSQQESLQNRDQQLIMSEFQLSNKEGLVTTDMINEARQKLDPINFNKLMISYVSAKQARKSSQAIADNIAKDWTDPIAFADSKPSDINKSFQFLVNDYKQRQVNAGKPEPSDIEAKVALIDSAGGEVPQFTKEITNMLASGRPDLMLQASNAYTAVGGLKVPLNSKAQALMFSFRNSIEQGRTPEEAAFITSQQYQNKTPEQIAGVNDQYKNYASQNLKDYRQANNHAIKLLDIPRFSDVPNASTIYNQANLAFETNFKLTGGNETAAREMTQHNLSQVYGVTRVNGTKQFSYLPIEKFVGIEEGVQGIIQEDAANQVSTQLMQTKEAFDKGYNDYYYRIAPHIDYHTALKNKKIISPVEQSASPYNVLIKNKKPEATITNDSEYRLALKQNKEFYDGKPITIEKVWRNKEVQQFDMHIQSSDNNGLGINSSTPIVGGYIISLRDRNNGSIQPIIGTDHVATSNIVYRPDIKSIQNKYIELFGLEPQETREEYDFRKKAFLERSNLQEQVRNNPKNNFGGN